VFLIKEKLFFYARCYDVYCIKQGHERSLTLCFKSELYAMQR